MRRAIMTWATLMLIRTITLHDPPSGRTGQRTSLPPPRRGWHAVKRIHQYAFRQLLDETGYWIVLGIVLSAVVAAALPPTFFERYLDNER